MEIVINLQPFYEFMSLPPDQMLWKMFWLFGWIPTSIAFLWLFSQIWLDYITTKYAMTIKKVLLAIDIPRGNEQSPKAVENMFSYLAGAHSTFSLIETYWEGKFQQTFSYEIVSIDGYTQFVIRTPEVFRDLVETSIYSQYPDAEITEINDYTEGIPSKFPDDEYDIWGAEFVQARKPAYPIKTYKDFEHQMGEPSTHYKDPMASLMDLCSSLRKGEQLWYQIIVRPIGFDWPEIGDKEISKILGEKPESKTTFIDRILDGILSLISGASDLVLKLGEAGESAKEKKEEDTFKMFNLKPKEKKQIDAIQEKIAKLGFEFKIRMIYVAKKEVMNKPKVANGFVGYIKQFAVNDLNNLKPDMDLTATSANYFFAKQRINTRKVKIMGAYKRRDPWAGKNRGVMNIEELASIWHFPVEAVVKAPLIQKAPGRKAEPPMSLPIGEQIVGEEITQPFFEGEEELEFKEDVADKKQKKQVEKELEAELAVPDGNPPENLPFV